MATLWQLAWGQAHTKQQQQPILATHTRRIRLFLDLFICLLILRYVMLQQQRIMHRDSRFRASVSVSVYQVIPVL